MGLWGWIQQDWFVLLQTAGIIGSLLFAGISLRTDTKVRKVANLITITKQHRDIWENFYSEPDLARVLEPSADLDRQPLTPTEEIFVTLLILHLNSAYYAMKEGVFITPEGLRRDIRGFFSLPLPIAVWNKLKRLQDQEFVRFVENNLHQEPFG